MSQYGGFTTVELRKPQRSKFDLSHEVRLSTKMGRLTPIFCIETLPNDSFKIDSEFMMRFAPLISPIMHRVNLFLHVFYVNNRLLWKDWEKFITNGRLGTETPPVPPNAFVNVIQGRGLGHLNLKTPSDYLGVGQITDADAGYDGVAIDLMPHAAFYKVWYDYYRDRNYVDDNEHLPLASGVLSNGATIDDLFNNKIRDWQKDYYTSALAFTQRGDEVLMPLVGSGEGIVDYMDFSLVKSSAGAPITADKLMGNSTTFGAGGDLAVDKTSIGNAGVRGRIENIETIDVDIDSSSVSINDLRRAVKLQQWLERQALAGSRMNETIWAHFNRRTSDGRLQRAEYLGGAKMVVKVSEVLTTAYSEDDAAEVVPPGNMAGRGMVLEGSGPIRYNCEEWGFIVGVLSVMPTSGYMQGTDRMFLARNTFLDYPWPLLAHLGEQPVLKYELYQSAANTPADRTTQPLFGYQSRFADWKHKQSRCAGDFKTSLDHWHLTRKFASSPTLGSTFVNFETDLQDRVFAVSGVDTLWCYIYNKIDVIRSLPYYGTPML